VVHNIIVVSRVMESCHKRAWEAERYEQDERQKVAWWRYLGKKYKNIIVIRHKAQIVRLIGRLQGASSSQRLQ